MPLVGKTFVGIAGESRAVESESSEIRGERRSRSADHSLGRRSQLPSPGKSFNAASRNRRAVVWAGRHPGDRGAEACRALSHPPRPGRTRVEFCPAITRGEAESHDCFLFLFAA